MQQNSLLVHNKREAVLKNKVSKGAVAGLVQPEPFVDHNLEATLSHAASARRYAQASRLNSPDSVWSLVTSGITATSPTCQKTWSWVRVSQSYRPT